MTMTFGIGAKEQELDAVAEILAEIFEVKFDQRESSFRGGDYCWAESPEGELILQHNRELPEDEPFESGWPIDQLILYIDGEDDYSWQNGIHALETTQRIGVGRLK